jgi:hypothetical protein
MSKLLNNKKQSFFFNFYQTILRPDYINNDKILSPNYYQNSESFRLFSNFGINTFEDLKIFRILKLFFILTGQKPKYSNFKSLKKERNFGGVFIGKDFRGHSLYLFLDFLYFIFFPRLIEKYILYKFDLYNFFSFKINDLSGFTYLVDDIFKSNFSLFLKSKHNYQNYVSINFFPIILFNKFIKK